MIKKERLCSRNIDYGIWHKSDEWRGGIKHMKKVMEAAAGSKSN